MTRESNESVYVRGEVGLDARVFRHRPGASRVLEKALLDSRARRGPVLSANVVRLSTAIYGRARRTLYVLLRCDRRVYHRSSARGRHSPEQF